MSVLNRTQVFLQDLWHLRDPRVDPYPLMSSPLPTLMLSIVYVIGSTIVGPIVMRNRRPIDLKSVMLAYNALQIGFNLYMVNLGLRGGWWFSYSFVCQPVDYSDDWRAVMLVHVGWLFFFSKFIDFLDTLFFVLRKKFSQVTFLHVAHHALMPVFLWPLQRYAPGGHCSLDAVINGSVHVIMYTYYLISALGPAFRPYLWWKRYLTWIQIAQFLTNIGHSALLFVVPDCGYPWQVAIYLVSVNVFFFVLFAQFYVQAYLDKGEQSTSKLESDDDKYKKSLHKEINKRKRQ